VLADRPRGHNEVEHGSGLGAFLKRGGRPHYLPYPYPYPYPTLPYPTQPVMKKGKAGMHGHYAKLQNAPPGDVIRKEARSFYRAISGVRLCWELEEPKGPKGQPSTSKLCLTRVDRLFSS